MHYVYAFDIYGTLIDTYGIRQQLSDWIGDKADSFSHHWRTKQLEYTFRRTAMMVGNAPASYRNFDDCIQAALTYTDQLYQTHLSTDQKMQLLQRYTQLPAFFDAEPCLIKLKNMTAEGWAFSNGTLISIQSLLDYAGLATYLAGLYSVDAVQAFKPAFKVYQDFARQRAQSLTVGQGWSDYSSQPASQDGCQCVLVSSNPFDIVGAKAAGWQAVWVNRNPEICFDPWEWQPDHTVNSLVELTFVQGR